MMPTKLLPCPFCGNTAHIAKLKSSVSPRYYVVCSNGMNQCIAAEHWVFGRFYDTIGKATEAWNRRTK